MELVVCPTHILLSQYLWWFCVNVKMRMNVERDGAVGAGLQVN